MNKKKGAKALHPSPLSSAGARVSQTRPALSSPVIVLHIDDDSNDTILLQAAVHKAGARFTLVNVPDGEHAMAYLGGVGEYGDRTRFPLPALILLDLKMPRLTGFEILKWIRKHPDLGRVPVLVLSGSQLQDDMRQAYAVGADSYLVKPLGFESLVGLIQNIDSRWLAPQALPRA